MILEIRAALPFLTNGFVLGCDDMKVGLLVDPGDNVGDLLAAVREHELTVSHIVLTHAHLDHITGVAAAKSALDVPVLLHPADRHLYDAIVQQGQMFGLRLMPQPPPDAELEAGMRIPFGKYEARVHHTPGHSPGSVCLQVGPAGAPGRTLFVGDTLFAGSIGRTDLPGGHLDTLLRSIRDVLFPLGDDALVYPGHGEQTTIGKERRSNPFLQ